MRHVAIEGRLSLTGAAADERHVARTHERLHYLVFLGLELQKLGAVELDVLSQLDPKVGSAEAWLTGLARDLWNDRGRALVHSGSTDPAEQALVAMLNRTLGHLSNASEGDQISESVPFTGAADADTLLVGLREGRFGGAVFLDVNPVEELPTGDELAALLGKLPLSVAITDRPTATAEACKIVASAHHAMERWFDAEPTPRVHTIGQPTLRALFNTRDPLESLLRWNGAEVIDPRSFVEELWEKRHGPGTWQAALARGGEWNSQKPLLERGNVVAQEPAPWSMERRKAVAQSLGGRLHEAAPSLEVELVREVGLLAGRNSANPWVRELPDPLTRVSWKGVACVAPSRADAMGISDGDVLSVTVGDIEVRLPARVQPGLHGDVISVPVGYGLRDGDGNTKKRNAYRLAQRGPEGGWIAAGLHAKLSLTGVREPLPIVQPHPSAEGRPIVHQVESPSAAVLTNHHGTGSAHGSLWTDHEYDDTHWEMVIDLDKCTGCSACVLSCQSENNLPVVGPEQMAMHRDMSWLRIDRYFEGDEREPDVLFEPMLCAQCDNAPCETVCPVAATVHSADGLNLQAYNRCVGTRYCANNCPYKARRFNWLDYTPTDPIERLALNPDVVVRERGVMEKCTFCIQRIQRTRIEAKKAGSPMPDPVTACQQSCPASAIHFGNGADPKPGMLALKEAKRAFQVLGELGIRPSITYLARIRPPRGGSR